nr:ABC transporter ATP-binding protein [Thermoleophilaceae bacterium]
VDDVVVIAGGALRANGPLEQVLGGGAGPVTRVRAAEPQRLGSILSDQGIRADSDAAGALIARGVTPDRVGKLAADHGLALIELVAVSRSLEEAFLDLTADPS